MVLDEGCVLPCAKQQFVCDGCSLERRPTEGPVHGEIAAEASGVPLFGFLFLPRPALFVGLGLTNANAIDPGPSLIK